jgi:GntR family transcriptional regulator
MSQPKYVVIEKKLSEEIRNGTYPAGSELPSENEMIHLFGVSRITVRRAFDDLYREGYIEKRQGKRGFVRETERVQELATLSSYTEEILRQGMKPSRRMVCSDLRLCNEAEQAALGLDKADPVFHMERIIYADEQPLCYARTTIPYRYFRNIETHDFSKESLYNVIEHLYGIKISRSTLKLKAVSADQKLGSYLNVGKDVPLLYTSAVTYGLYDHAEVPIETFETYYLTDRIEYVLTQKR